MIAVRPLTRERWPDLEAVFNARGCSVARRCWCMFYRVEGRSGFGLLSRAPENRAQLKKLAGGDSPPGLVGYRGKTPVGWISLGPREDYPKLATSRVMKAVDETPVWSIICFVVPSEHRHQGVATAMLEGAIRYARKRGAKILEAYPVDVSGKAADDSLWFGPLSMYEAAGFEEVARRKATRPVVRLKL
jgi:ribosomal protein S18 acetylase RimI-like enzyme